MIPEYFVWVGIIINFIGGASYIIDTLRGKVQPNRITWGLWAIPILIIFTAQRAGGVGIQSWMTFTVGFIPLLVFLASFVNKKAYWKITKFDMICGTLSLIGLVAWQVTKVGNMAILFSILLT